MFDGDFRKFYLLRCMAIRDTPWRCVFLLLFFLRWEFSIQRLELLGWRSIFFVIQPPKRPEHFRKFRWVGPGTRTTFNPFPNTPRSWCAKNTMCLVSPHHCFRSVGAWLIPKKKRGFTQKTLGLILVMLLDQIQYMYFCLQKLWQILLAPKKKSSKECLHQRICKKPQSELVWCTEASTMPSLMRVTTMRFVSPKGEWEGHLLLIFWKQSQDARHDDDSLKWNDDSVSFGSLGR